MMNNTIKTLQALNLTCVRQQQIIFAQLSFSLNAGELLLVEGPNGAGKSSLLRLLAGLITPAAGHIVWYDQSQQDIATSKEKYRENLHYLGHAHGIKLGLTVTENIQLASHLHKTNFADLSHQQEEIFTQLQLHAHQHTLAKYLSAGQKRRVALAKLLLLPKMLWILDEPLTALDASTQNFFLAQLTQHINRGGIAIISSHQSMHLADLNIKNIRLPLC